MIGKLKKILHQAETWPEADQRELANYAEEIAALREGKEYRPTEEELAAIDEAERSGVATEADVKAAFRAFRRG